MRSDSHCLQACVTLDLCGDTFKSELLRTGRLQVNYVKGGKAGISNEIVSYQPGGAKLAMSELNRAVSGCPNTPVPSGIRGIGPLMYRIKRLTDTRLLPGSVALLVHVSGTANGQHIAGTTIGIFQVQGDHLSGVYTTLGADSTAPQQTRLALHAAEASAQNLTKAGMRA